VIRKVSDQEYDKCDVETGKSQIQASMAFDDDEEEED
jgi:hypothetical protein